MAYATFVLSAAPPNVKHALTRWMLEPAPGVFVGNMSARVRDGLWAVVEKVIGEGHAVLIHNDATEQGFTLRTCGESRRHVVDYEGLLLISRSQQTGGEDSEGHGFVEMPRQRREGGKWRDATVPVAAQRNEQQHPDDDITRSGSPGIVGAEAPSDAQPPPGSGHVPPRPAVPPSATFSVYDSSSGPGLMHDPAVNPILCGPFDEPDRCWPLDAAGRAMRGRSPLSGRRPSMTLNPVPDDEKLGQREMDLGEQAPREEINNIRSAVGVWRSGRYEGVTETTRKLLEHWAADDAGSTRRRRPFFAQREAIETLVWLAEIAKPGTRERKAIEDKSRDANDGIVRWAVKMATGTGKTAVMGMLIAWQTLNAVRDPSRFGSRFLVLAPGLTIRNRLRVLRPSEHDSVYADMGLLPPSVNPHDLNFAQVTILNYQAFARRALIESGYGRGTGGARAVRELLGAGGAETETYKRVLARVLAEALPRQGTRNAAGRLVVINDEAHHCYKPKEDARRTAADKKQDDRAAVWYSTIKALRDDDALTGPVFDFSATPFRIDSAARTRPEPFGWVVSDFGLMDAIESGLVKVPRTPVNDDSAATETIWRRIYKNTSPKKLPSHKGPGLPGPLNEALAAVVDDYTETLALWQQAGRAEPPVMIVVANDITNAEHLYRHIAGTPGEDGEPGQPGRWGSFSNITPDGQLRPGLRTLMVHSDIGDDHDLPKRARDAIKAHYGDSISTSDIKDPVSAVRRVVDTVGKPGQPGAQIRCVISVGMLTEGWDAQTVTHIVGFRAFSTQLLCEQVTGRALRRSSYEILRPDGRYDPEYAEVVGVPFEFMPSTGRIGPPPPPPPKTAVSTVEDRRALRITWPRVDGYRQISAEPEWVFNPDMVAAWAPRDTASVTDLGALPPAIRKHLRAPMFRRQSVEFLLAGALAARHRQRSDAEGRDHVADLFRGAKRAARLWMNHPQVTLPPNGAWTDDILASAADAMLASCDDPDTRLVKSVDLAAPPLADTGAVMFDTSLKDIYGPTLKSELSHAACHSLLEKLTAAELDAHPRVEAWVRNFRLGWTVPYAIDGAWHSYEPDFVCRLDTGLCVIVECKGVYDDKAEAAEHHTRGRWIPGITTCPNLPDDLHHWEYLIVNDHAHIRGRLNALAGEPADADILQPA